MRNAATRLTLALPVVLAVLTQHVEAQDTPNSKDHPAVARYSGASIVYYKQFDYDEAAFLRAPLPVGRDAEASKAEWLKLEGRITNIRYSFPAHQSSLQIIRRYESALTTNGFEILFKCNDLECLKGGVQSDLYLLGEKLDPTSGKPMAYYDHGRYLLARGGDAAKPTYVSLIVGERLESSIAFLSVAEPPQPAPASGPGKCEMLIGPWRNVNLDTRSLPLVSFDGVCERGSGSFQMRVWGRCHPRNCDWGTTPASYDETRNTGTAASSSSFDVTGIEFSLNEAGQLVVKSSTRFIDASGRGRQENIDVFTAAWLGALLGRIDSAAAAKYRATPGRGVVVMKVDEKGPAMQAGLAPGDVLVRFDGRDISDTRDVSNIIASKPIGATIDIIVLRDGREQLARIVTARFRMNE
jgi:hypothetical protein